MSEKLSIKTRKIFVEWERTAICRLWTADHYGERDKKPWKCGGTEKIDKRQKWKANLSVLNRVEEKKDSVKCHKKKK